MAELLDEALFEGKTYGDLLQRHRRPYLHIHATDMATLSRFEFSQMQFDWICSDLSQLPVARASAASAALPLVLSPISYKNYAGTCGFEVPAEALELALKRGGVAAPRAKEYQSYLDLEKRGYIHLLDGGLSDNMAIRALLEGSTVSGGIGKMMQYWRVKKVKKFVILAVGAETSPDVMDFGGDQIPTLAKAMTSLIDVPINRYSADSVALMHLGVKLVRENCAKSRDHPTVLSPRMLRSISSIRVSVRSKIPLNGSR